jgi:hypothetical protein
MLAAKFFDDFYFKNEYYAKVGGITKLEMNLLERDYLEMVNFDLFVSPGLFWSYHEKLITYSAVNND